MKALILILASISLYASNPTSCNQKYDSLVSKSENFSNQSLNQPPREILKSATSLEKEVYGYLTTCCKTTECKDEMYESLNELDQIIKVTSMMVKGD